MAFEREENKGKRPDVKEVRNNLSTPKGSRQGLIPVMRNDTGDKDDAPKNVQSNLPKGSGSKSNVAADPKVGTARAVKANVK